MIGVVRRLEALFDRRVKRRLLLVVLGSLLIALAEALAMVAVLPLMALVTGATPRSSRELRILDDLFGHPAPDRLAVYVALLVLSGFVLKGVAALAIRWWSIGFVLQEGTRRAATLLRHFLRAPYAVHLRRGTPDLLRVLNEGVGALHSAIVLGSVSIVTEAITIAVLGTALLIVNPVGTVALGAYFGIAAWVLQRVVRQHATRAGVAIMESAYVSNKTALHALGGIKEVKLRHEEEMFVSEYFAARSRAASAWRVSNFIADLPKYVLEILFITGVGLITALAYSQSDPSRALGTVALVGLAGFRILPSVVRMLASVNIVRAALPSLDVVEADLLEAVTSDEPRPPQTSRLPLTKDLVLTDVRFRYADADHDVLSDISLRLPAGSSLALVGGSGAGKTTLADVILGFHRPTSGQVAADGVDVFGSLDEWQAGLAMVPQDVFMLDESLRDNIRFTAREADHVDPLMDDVVAHAQLSDMIEALTEGLETKVGERGARLSGGQRQRVGIARALYRQPALLVLDEATSALDNETEHKVARTLDELSGSLTMIVVAHRLSTVRHCDQVVVLEAGRIRAIGTFEELLRTDDYFARLVQLGSLET